MHRDEIRIPTPCHADWNAMERRDRARFCTECQLEVIDVSARTEAEARAMVENRERGRACVSYVVGKDGRIRFADSPRRPPAAPDVPKSALVRRGSGALAAASIALAACSPLDAITEAMGMRTSGTPVVTVEPDEPCDRIAGEMARVVDPPATDAPLPGDPANASPADLQPVLAVPEVDEEPKDDRSDKNDAWEIHGAWPD